MELLELAVSRSPVPELEAFESMGPVESLQGLENSLWKGPVG
jgi:hypothetical protein